MASRRNAASPGILDIDDAAGLAARRVAHEAVAGLLDKNRALALEDALAQAALRAPLPPADAALARAIATTAFRRLGFYRAALSERLDRGLPDDAPRLQALLLTGAAQILDLAVPDHAAVDLSVRLAKADPQARHFAGLVNAVLRRLSREKAAISGGDPLAINTPAWLVQRWERHYGADTAARIAAAHLNGACVDLTVRGDADEWAQRLGGVRLDLGSVRLAGTRVGIVDLEGFAEGQWWVQDAAATLPARLLAPRRGERVADLCAAPGGKTAQLADTGASVLAVDRSSTRLQRLAQNLARLQLAAATHVGDALHLPEDEPFDAVLLDAPCSATGTIRRHPDVAWTKTTADIARLAALQTRLLDKAARLVRPGGRIVYCSCSLEPEEGEAQAEAFLARHPGFVRVPVEPGEVAGHVEMIGPAGDLRTLPCHLDGDGVARGNGLDGFFATRLRRLDG